ncbi:MAG: hypothetical protein WB952_14740 [Terriglobales bacterium]
MSTNRARNIDASNSLDNVAVVCFNSLVARAHDVLNRIQGALAVDAARMKEIAAEMAKHADAYYRYQALQRQSAEHEKSAHGLMALLGPKAFVAVMTNDQTDSIGEEVDVTPSPTMLRASATLWEHVQNYLRFVPESQVNEIVEFLGWVGIETSRQAVESAIKTHGKVFQVKKRGRERFVSLRGA